jgi:C4-dicarboxylate-specific signal transduction histidine kinase
LAHVLRADTMGEMAAGIAHELNQPLSAIINYAKGSVRRLQDGNTHPSDILDAMAAIAGEAARASEIIRSLKRYISRCETHRKRIDLNTVVEAAAQIVRGEAHQHEVALLVRCTTGLPKCFGDQIQLEQVVVNLLTNAIESLERARASRRLVVETSQSKAGEIQVSVRDNGPGLGTDGMQHIFDAFYTTKPQGLGMGLAISRSIVEAHGGKLWAEANPEGGAIFRFTLPVHQELL